MSGKTSPNPSKTKSSEKDYWRSPPELINDALALIGAHKFGVDVCCSSREISIAEYCITEQQDALSINWRQNDGNYPFFCNPPFSRKWEFFTQAVKQVNRSKIPCLFVMPYERVSKLWAQHVTPANCIVYVPNGRYNYLKPDGSKGDGCTFGTSLIYIVPHYTNGAIYIDYERGCYGMERNKMG